MSIDSLPIDLLIKIFHQLPFKDHVHLAGVSRSFRDASDESISRMKSLDVTDYLMNYSIAFQSFPSLLESSSSTLKSIVATDLSYKSKLLVKILTDFVFPKLEHLDLSINAEGAKKMISQHPNLRSIVLHGFGWPQDIVFVKLENLTIYPGNYSELSMLRPLIDNVPNLKHLSIKSVHKQRPFIISVEEISQLLASTPFLEELHLDLRGLAFRTCQNFMAAIPSWHLPLLTRLVIDFNLKYLKKNMVPTSIQHGISASFPQLKSFTSNLINRIDDQTLLTLSQLEYLRELRLPELAITKDMFNKLDTSIPSIAVLEIKSLPWTDEKIDDQSHLENLRELYLGCRMAKDEIIDLINSIPSITILEIEGISDVFSTTFVDFLMSTGAIFHRNLVIRLRSFNVRLELDQLKVALEEMKNNGGPVIEVNSQERDRFQQYIKEIQYGYLIG